MIRKSSQSPPRNKPILQQGKFKYGLKPSSTIKDNSKCCLWSYEPTCDGIL